MLSSQQHGFENLKEIEVIQIFGVNMTFISSNELNIQFFTS